jgi:gp16 family phage-associated protein
MSSPFADAGRARACGDEHTAPSDEYAAPPATRTAEDVRAEFRAVGVSVADWAREHGFSVELTRMVLAGQRKCLRGQSHKIAVALGMKSQPSNSRLLRR